MACVTALHHRNRTGEGQWIDLSQVESGIALTGTAILDKTVNGRPYRREGNPPGNRSPHPRVAPHNTYRCEGEDQWCAITIFDDRTMGRVRTGHRRARLDSRTRASPPTKDAATTRTNSTPS